MLSELFPEDGFEVGVAEKPSKRLTCGTELKGFRKRWHDRSKLSFPVPSPETSASSTPSTGQTLISEFANQAFDQLKKRSKTIVMPWEEPLYAPIFGSFIPSIYRTMPEVSFVPEPPSVRENVKESSIKPAETDATQSIFKWRVQTEKAVDDYQTVNKTKRLVALGKWRKILEHCKDELNLAWMFFGDAPLEDDIILGSLEDVFGAKATSTIGKRAGSMMQYVTWAKSQGYPPFPVTEKNVFLCEIFECYSRAFSGNVFQRSTQLLQTCSGNGEHERCIGL